MIINPTQLEAVRADEAWPPLKEPIQRTIQAGRVRVDSILFRMWNELVAMRVEVNKPAAS